MTKNVLFQTKHQLWLKMAFLSFTINNPKSKSRLYEFSQIEFRHLKWLAQSLYETNIPYDYERDPQFTIEGNTFFGLLESTILALQNVRLLYDDTPLSQRMAHDEHYMLTTLDGYFETSNELITAFDRACEWKEGELTDSETDALTLFLFEELYKEYELIMVYFYQQVRASTPMQVTHFQDLIDESHFHLRSFGEMMGQMGILSLPRPLHPLTYQIENRENFLHEGIIEEENAKEECQKLSSSIRDKKLSAFFEFINFQESYHIEIMKKLLKEP